MIVPQLTKRLAAMRAVFVLGPWIAKTDECWVQRARGLNGFPVGSNATFMTKFRRVSCRALSLRDFVGKSGMLGLRCCSLADLGTIINWLKID